MSEIDLDLLEQSIPELDLDEVMPGPLPVAPLAVSAANAAVLAAQETMAQMGTESVFSDLASSFKVGDGVDALSLIDDEEQVAEDEALLGVLADPSVPDEAKSSAISARRARQVRTARQRLAEEVIVQEPSIAPSSEQDREMMGIRMESLNQILEVNRAREAVINNEMIGRDLTFTGSLLDIGELMIPFTEQKAVGRILTAARAKFDLGELKEAGSGINEAIFLMGNAKEGFREILLRAPLDKRKEVLFGLVQIIREHSDILFSDTNDLFALSMIEQLIDANTELGFSDGLDNAISILDMIGVGSSIFRAVPALVSLPAQALRKARWLNIKPGARPASAGKTIDAANSDVAKRLFANIDTMSAEEIRAIYGREPDEVLAGTLLPDLVHPDGTLPATTVISMGEVPRIVRGSEEVLEELGRVDAKMWLTDVELANIQKKTGRDIIDASSFPQQSVVLESAPDGTGIRYSLILGEAEGTAVRPADLLNRVQRRLARIGVQRKDMQLMVSRLGELSPINPSDYVPVPGDTFKVMVRGHKAVTHRDMLGIDPWHTRAIGRLFYRLPGGIYGDSQRGTGASARWVFDPQSILDPKATKPAALAVDRTSRIEERLHSIASKFSKLTQKLSKQEAAILNDMVITANSLRRTFSNKSMIAKGLSPQAREAYRVWREYWDTAYILENRDLTQSLQNQGFQFFDNPRQGTQILAKPVERGRLPGNLRAYDSETDTIVRLTAAAVDELYETGGTIAKARNPIRLPGTRRGKGPRTDYVISREADNGGRMRPIGDNEGVLSYLDGYYTVRYKDGYFVTLRNVGDEGEHSQAVSVAATSHDAEDWAKVYTGQNSDVVPWPHDKPLPVGDDRTFISVRRDRSHGLRRLSDEQDYWDLNRTIGRTNQKRRGEPLYDASTCCVYGPDHSMIMSPDEAMAANARALAGRVGMRATITALKHKVMAQWPGAFPIQGKNHQPVWPTEAPKVGDTAASSVAKSNEFAEAAAYWEYISSLESVYINSIDNTIKAGWNLLAENLEKYSVAHKAVKLAEDSPLGHPIGSLKHAAFTLNLSWHPFRQVILQSSQAQMLMGVAPKYVATGLAQDLFTVIGTLWKNPKAVTGMDTAGRVDPLQILKEFEEFGFSASIDRQILVRGTLIDMADEYTEKGLTKWTKMPTRAVKSAGFDAGEWTNLMTAYLVFRRKAVEAGKNLKNPRELAAVAEKTRSFTLSMNQAGDMQANKGIGAVSTLASLVYQFMAVPHKATLALMNRNLSLRERSSIFLGSFALWGLPIEMVVKGLGQYLPEPGSIQRQILEEGLEGALINTAITYANRAYDSEASETHINFNGLAPANAYGMYDMIHAALTGNIGEILSNSAGPGLLFGNNPKLTNFFRSVTQLVYAPDEWESENAYRDAVVSAMKLSSGMSAFFAYSMSEKAGMKKNASGATVDPSSTWFENAAALVGFPSIAESRIRAIRREEWMASKEYRSDIRKYYKRVQQALANEEIYVENPMFDHRAFGIMAETFGNTQAFRDELSRLMKKGVEQGDDYANFANMSMHLGVVDPDQALHNAKALANDGVITQEEADSYGRVLQSIQDTSLELLGIE